MLKLKIRRIGLQIQYNINMEKETTSLPLSTKSINIHIT